MANIINTEEAQEVLDLLAEMLTTNLEDLLRAIRRELTRRLREGEPAALWEAAEIVVEWIVSELGGGLAAAADYLFPY